MWHYALTKAQSESLEAVHITHNLTRGMLYSSMLLRVNLDSLATRREGLSRRFFSVISWILHHVSTASFLHPDPPLSHLGSDLHKSFLESILVPSAIVPSYNMDLTTTSKPILSTMTSIRLFVLGLFCHSAVAFNVFNDFFRVFMFYGLSVWLCFFQ